MSGRLSVRHGSTTEADERRAVGELKEQIAQTSTSAVVFFASPKYDLCRLGAVVREAFDAPVVGCTSAGQIGPSGFQAGGMTAASLASSDLTVTPYLLRPLSDWNSQTQGLAQLVEARRIPERRSFGLLLVDGLSMMEERLAASLYHSLGGLPIVGGSAGDDLAFRSTHVYFNGAFLDDAAVLTLFQTTLPFSTFRFQHVAPTDNKLVVTDADVERRLLREIDGEPAVDAYARIVGVPVAGLTAQVFSKNPLMLRLGDEYFVRSIHRANPDGSFSLLCAIESGVVLTVGKGVDPVPSAERAFRAFAESVARPQVILGCDCILRRLELETDGLDKAVGDVFSRNKVIGFSTYGEQFNGLHVNQTFTGVAIGG